MKNQDLWSQKQQKYGVLLLEVTQFDPRNCKVIVSSAFHRNEKGNRRKIIFCCFSTFVININIFVTPWEDILKRGILSKSLLQRTSVPWMQKHKFPLLDSTLRQLIARNAEFCFYIKTCFEIVTPYFALFQQKNLLFLSKIVHCTFNSKQPLPPWWIVIR